MPQSISVLDSTGATQVIQHTVPGTAGAPSSDVVSVQGVPGGTPLSVHTTSVAIVDHSGFITVGGTAQQLCAANLSRIGLLIQNQSSSDLWINRKGAAAVIGSPSIRIPANSYWESPVGGGGTAAVSIIGATSGQTFTAEEW